MVTSTSLQQASAEPVCVLIEATSCLPACLIVFQEAELLDSSKHVPAWSPRRLTPSLLKASKIIEMFGSYEN